jgi:hypothetical protein
VSDDNSDDDCNEKRIMKRKKRIKIMMKEYISKAGLQNLPAVD